MSAEPTPEDIDTRGDRRERRRRKRRYGMTLSGRSLLVLAKQTRGEGARVRRRRKKPRLKSGS